MGGDAPPPLEKGVKMFELSQLNLFTPEKKKGEGAATGDLSPHAGTRWDWGGCGLRGGPGLGRRPGRR